MGVQMLTNALKWVPFDFPALGFFALFAPKEMDTAIGNLASSWATDFLPALGSYTVAKDDFATSQPGFVLYNLTDGIMTTYVAAWFTRWLMSSQLTPTSTVIRLKTDSTPWPLHLRVGGFGISWNLLGFPLLLALKTGDRWGFANGVVMGAAVVVRQLMVSQRRSFIDQAVEKSPNVPNTEVKLFLTLPNGKAVTILTPRNLMMNCILTDTQPTNPCYYNLLRIMGWVLLTAQFVTLSMSSLPVQIMSICVLLLGTYLTAIHLGSKLEYLGPVIMPWLVLTAQFATFYMSSLPLLIVTLCVLSLGTYLMVNLLGSQPEYIGSRLRLETDDRDPDWSRSQVYAQFDMTKDEEDAMVNWSLLPQRSNQIWWDRYEREYLAPRREAKQVGPTPYSL